MSPTHNLSSKIGSERRGKIFTNGNSQSSAISASVMPNVYALCGICTTRFISSAQIICYAKRVCILWHLFLQIYIICTDAFVMKEHVCILWHLYIQSYAICTGTSAIKNLYAFSGVCTSRAMSSAHIHLLSRTCMHSMAFVPPELCHLDRYICYEEHVCTLWHLYLQSNVIYTDIFVMKNGSLLCLHSCVICTGHPVVLYRVQC